MESRENSQVPNTVLTSGLRKSRFFSPRSVTSPEDTHGVSLNGGVSGSVSAKSNETNQKLGSAQLLNGSENLNPSKGQDRRPFVLQDMDVNRLVHANRSSSTRDNESKGLPQGLPGLGTFNNHQENGLLKALNPSTDPKDPPGRNQAQMFRPLYHTEAPYHQPTPVPSLQGSRDGSTPGSSSSDISPGVQTNNRIPVYRDSVHWEVTPPKSQNGVGGASWLTEVLGQGASAIPPAFNASSNTNRQPANASPAPPAPVQGNLGFELLEQQLQQLNLIPDGWQTPQRPFQMPPHRIQEFHPMTAIHDPSLPGFARAPSNFNAAHPLSREFSLGYNGMWNSANASASVTDDRNCSLWLTKLPADVTYSELLGLIANSGPFGRVYCTYINYPDNVDHHMAAAKVVFYHPEPAQRMLSQSWASGLSIRGHKLTITHNRIKTASVDAIPGHGDTSRVLIITGSEDFVNVANLSAYFGHKFVYQLDEAKELVRAGGRAVVEFRFGSFRCQAQMGRMALERERPAGLDKVEFGPDPCENGEMYASFSIAAERIQGKGM